MKVKWRSQEHLLVGFMAVLTASVGVSRVYYGTEAHRLQWALITLANIALLYTGYLWLNGLIVPMLRKAFKAPSLAVALLLVLGAAGQVLVLTYLLGLGNVINPDRVVFNVRPIPGDDAEL